MKKTRKYLLLLVCLMLFVQLAGFASTPQVAEKTGTQQTAPEPEKGFNFALRGFAAALAIGLSALATSFAQARIGSAGMGAIAEKPELTGRVMLLVAIPETLVILGFVIAAMIIL